MYICPWRPAPEPPPSSFLQIDAAEEIRLLQKRTFSVIKSFSGTTTSRSNRRTSSGASFEIPRIDIFLPMHERRPAPKYTTQSMLADRPRFVQVTRLDGRPYGKKIDVHRSRRFWAFEPPLRTKGVSVKSKYISTSICDPCIHSDHCSCQRLTVRD